MNIWLIFFLALVGTVLIFALIGFFICLGAGRIRRDAILLGDKLVAAEAGRIDALRAVVSEVGMPEKLSDLYDEIRILNYGDPDFGAMRGKVDFALIILASRSRAEGDEAAAARIKEVYDAGAEAFLRYNRKAMTFNALIKVLPARPFARLMKLETLPVFTA